MNIQPNSWLCTLAVGVPILGFLVWLRWRRVLASPWWRLVLCIVTASVFTPVWIYIGASPIIVPAVVMIGFMFTGEAEGLRMAFSAGVLPITPACAAENEAVKQDLAQLQGEWSMVSGSADGQPMPDAMLKQMKRVCKGEETTTTLGGQLFFRANITIDPSKKPKTIDYQMTDGLTKGQKQLGIYEVEGDTFRSCFGKPGAERPTDFTSKPGDGRTLSVWKRNKPATPEPGRK